MSTKKINIGILGNAKIAQEQLIPAIKISQHCNVLAIASRNLEGAKDTAKKFNIERTYASYEELLNDKDIDAIYNPLPNHLHVSMSIKALRAGKHVLCEKPIACNVTQTQTLITEARQHPSLKIMEAFMYKFHPLWKKAKELTQNGSIGTTRAIQSFLSYYNIDPENVRNQADIGGGGLLDLGCYNISFARFIFDDEPSQTKAIITTCPKFKTDIITSGLLLFPQDRHCSFTCATQLCRNQHVQIIGEQGVISFTPLYEISDAPMNLHITDNNGTTRTIAFEQQNHYTLQCDNFAQAILNDTPVPTPLSDALANMKVIDTIFKDGGM